MNEDLDWLWQILSDATGAITPEYFLLPVADLDGGAPIAKYRERVYAYELYHQLRLRWPAGWPYSLAGEIDKRGHPIIRGGFLDNSKPDLLVHVPGTMNHNLAVVEIKPLRSVVLTGEWEAFDHDFRKLIAFREVGYTAAFFLTFGESVDRVREYGGRLRQSGADLDAVTLCHHRRPGEQAVVVKW